MAPVKLLGFILLLFVCLEFTQSSKSKKTIKIHVPYYVKHIHHYKKVYVPKVQVVKHEHLHKKEHEHHHHHDHHDHGHHHHGYDKSSDGGHYEDYDSYYDDIDHRSYNDNRLPKSRPNNGFRGGNGARENWRDSSSSEEASSSEEDEYITGPENEGTLPAPLPNNLRNKPRPGPPKFRRTVIKRSDIIPTADTTLIITPSVNTLPKKIIARVQT